MTSSTPRDAVRLSSNAITVLEKRYLVKDDAGKPVGNTRGSLLARGANDRRGRPPVRRVGRRGGGGRAGVLQAHGGAALRAQLAHAHERRPPLGQLSACFVLPVDDALSNGKSGIYDTLRAMALVHQSGGGTGFSFSRLRPKNDIVRSTMGVASGPGLVHEPLRRLDRRRQAGRHPARRQHGHSPGRPPGHHGFRHLQGRHDQGHQLQHLGRGHRRLHGRRSRPTRCTTCIIPRRARSPGSSRRAKCGIASSMARGRRASPACSSSTRPITTIRSRTSAPTRPPIPAASSRCFRTTSATSAPSTSASSCATGQIDWDALRPVIHLATHFLENVIDANQYPLPEITDLAQRIRRIGLGVMGLADVFVKLGIPYDSEEGVALGRRIQQFVDEEAKIESERLATERGVFPEWERSIWGPDKTCARGPSGERIRPMRRLRNCNVTTVAPTGTISIIAGCSSGIEPLFAVAFMRNQAGSLMPDVNEDFVAIARAEGWYSDDLMRRIAEAGHIDFPEVPAKWQRVFVTANHIKPEWHIRMQAAFPGVQRQRHLEDLQLRPRRHRGLRRGDLPPRLQPRLQGSHGLPRRQPRHAGALDRQHRQEGQGGRRRSRRDARGRRTRVRPRRPARPARRGRGGERPAAPDRARPRGGESPAPPEALAPRAAARRHPPPRDAARHAVRHHHRGRSRASRSRCS